MAHDETTAQRERQVLRVICQGCSDGPVGTPSQRRLRSYPWSEPEHDALFRALDRLPTTSQDAIREWLPRRLTRLGFPDITWEDLFQPHGLSRTEAERLIDVLLGGSGGL